MSAATGLDGVLDALLDPNLEGPPAPQAVSRYLDAIAAGEAVTETLSKLGAFRDAVAPEKLSSSTSSTPQPLRR